MRLFAAPLLCALVLLSGCIGDQKQTQTPILSNPQAPTITIPAPTLMTPESVRAAVGTEMDRVSGASTSNLKNDIASSSNNTQQQLSGLVTTQISKLAESIKGVEANLNTTLNTTIQPQLTANATATANLNTKLESTINATATLQNTVTATLNNNLTANAEMKLALDRLTLQVSALGAAQAGVGNKIDQQTASLTAGHDVNNNNFPKEVVDVMLDREKSSSNRLLAILGAAQAILVIVLRNSRERERLRAENEKYERQRMTDLLMQAMGHVPPAVATQLQTQAKEMPPPTPGGFFRNLL